MNETRNVTKENKRNEKKSEKEKQTNEIKKFQKFLHWKLDSTTLTTVVQLHGLSNLSLSSSFGLLAKKKKKSNSNQHLNCNF